MKKEIVDRAYLDIDNFKEKLGEVFYDAIQEEDNFTYDMAKGIISVFDNQCNTDREFEIADAMLVATCGYGIETLISRIKERDKEGHCWESC